MIGFDSVQKMQLNISLLILLLLVSKYNSDAFTFLFPNNNNVVSRSSSSTTTSEAYLIKRKDNAVLLHMGRAAAVRAATKSKTDAKKAKTNAVFGKKLIVAVKNGGSADPASNRELADVIKQAKSNSVPVDNINRAIKKASDPDTSSFSESLYEAYGFGGASFIIHVLTDNSNRSNADVRIAVNKNDGKMAEQGSVAFMYDRKGKVTVAGDVDEETLLEAAIEAGCDDLEIAEGEEDDEGTSIVYTNPSELALMNEALNSIQKDVVKSELVYVSKAPVEVSDDDFEKNMKIIDALEECDDVNFVEHNIAN